MITQAEVRAVLASLGEEFLVDVPAQFDGKGTYLIEFTTLANALVNPTDEWLDQIVGYTNVKEHLA